WSSFKPGRLEQGEIRRIPPCAPACDVSLRNRRGKSGGMSYYPVREQPTSAAAGYSQFLFIDIATVNQFIHADHQIFVIVTRVTVLNHIPKILAVGSAATRIWIKHYISFSGHPLKFVFKDVAICGVWPAVNVQDERVFF